jgi:hypothetical protein
MTRRRRRGAASPGGLTGLVAFVIVVLVVLWLVRDRLPPLGTPSIPKPDTASKPSKPAPASNGLYEVYFTTPVYPDKPETRKGGIDEKFVA